MQPRGGGTWSRCVRVCCVRYLEIGSGDIAYGTAMAYCDTYGTDRAYGERRAVPRTDVGYAVTLSVCNVQY
eukprot:3940508-Rhodomonas_salina.5